MGLLLSLQSGHSACDEKQRCFTEHHMPNWPAQLAARRAADAAVSPSLGDGAPSEPVFCMFCALLPPTSSCFSLEQHELPVPITFMLPNGCSCTGCQRKTLALRPVSSPLNCCHCPLQSPSSLPPTRHMTSKTPGYFLSTQLPQCLLLLCLVALIPPHRLTPRLPCLHGKFPWPCGTQQSFLY